MTRHVRRRFAFGVIALGFTSSVAMAQGGRPGPIDVPDVPGSLRVPGGYSVYYQGHALGTQNFICLATGAGIAWRFLGPQATLFQFDGDIAQQNATHFLSANPVENGVARPTWQHSLDTSRVWAQAVSSSTDPEFVEAGAIPWLLLEVVGAATGPAGGATLTQTAYIHRLNTSGGLAPATGCSVAADVGRISLVPYAADYYFYKANGQR